MTTTKQKALASPFQENPRVALQRSEKAWEEFVCSGQLREDLIRPMIAQSWLRCRRDGVNPELERAPTESGLEEIGTILRVTDFGRAGQQVLNSFSPFVDGSGHLIVLADVGGRILYTVGNRGIQGLLERINFCPGGAWAEDIAGSNGVGTPLRSGQPEIVLGTEHYCRGWQPWVCYGCPVRAPGSGQPIGVVDVTGPALKAHAKNMMLTSSVAHAVEQQLLLFHLQRRNALLTSYRDMERRYPNEGIVVIDQEGLIVEVNSSALRILRMSPTTILGGSLATLAPDLWALFREGFQRKEDMSMRLEVETLEFARRTTACHAELLAAGGTIFGAGIILSERTVSSSENKRRSVTLEENSSPNCKYTFAHIQGNSATLRAALKLALQAARDPMHNPVLLIGESGTGKELVAHAIHAESPRSTGPFIAINCGALQKELVESELFGYVGNAFTGARREGQAGKFEAANGGTLMLDEIDSLPMNMQATMLRVLESGEVMRVGSSRTIATDVRVIAASSDNLREYVHDGRFRLDLLQRLSVLEVNLPPLREREGDVLTLAAAFIRESCAAVARPPLTLSDGVAKFLKAYSWPGNIRELRNLCTRWALTVEGGDIGLENLPDHLRNPPTIGADPTQGLRSVTDSLIYRTLSETEGNVREAAKRLGVASTTIYRRIKKPRPH